MSKAKALENLRETLKECPLIEVCDSNTVSKGESATHAWVKTWYKVELDPSKMVDSYQTALNLMGIHHFPGVAIVYGILVSRICDEYHALQGERPSLQEYVRRHPITVIAVNRMFEMMQEFKPPELAESLIECQERINRVQLAIPTRNEKSRGAEKEKDGATTGSV